MLTSNDFRNVTQGVNAPDGIGMCRIGGPVKDKSCREGEKERLWKKAVRGGRSLLALARNMSK